MTTRPARLDEALSSHVHCAPPFRLTLYKYAFGILFYASGILLND